MVEEVQGSMENVKGSNSIKSSNNPSSGTTIMDHIKNYENFNQNININIDGYGQGSLYNSSDLLQHVDDTIQSIRDGTLQDMDKSGEVRFFDVPSTKYLYND